MLSIAIILFCGFGLSEYLDFIEWQQEQKQKKNKRLPLKRK